MFSRRSILAMLGLAPLVACANQIPEEQPEWVPQCPSPCSTLNVKPVGDEDETILWLCEFGHAFGRPWKP